MARHPRFAAYVEACNFPGALDESAVEANLTTYLSALGVRREIRRLRANWLLESEPALARYVYAVLDDFARRPDARAASAARAARAARDARDAFAARAALDALDARDARSLHRFTTWCLQATSWLWWRFDLSWITTTAIGAKTDEVRAWSDPLLEAYIAGAWMLHWTEDALYWIAKPIVHVEQMPNGRRLHNDSYAAIESDIENLYFWHGVLVPAFVVMRPDWITVQHIDSEPNAEVRRVMTERYGEKRYLTDSGLVPIATDEFGELLRKDFSDDAPLVYVRVTNSTAEPDGSFRKYLLSVNPEHYDGDAGRIPHAAVASTWRTTPGGSELFFKGWHDYRPEVQT